LLSILLLGLRAIHCSFAKGDDDDCSDVKPKATSPGLVAKDTAAEDLHLQFLLMKTDEVL
jgi:hypothetical protein